MSHRRTSHFSRRALRLVRRAAIVLGAIVGTLADLHPVEIPVLDAVLTAATFAAVVWSAGRVPTGVLTAAALVAAIAAPLSWAAVCLAGVVALDLGRRAPLRRVAGRVGGLLLVLACTGLVDRGPAHSSAMVSTVAFVMILLAGVASLPSRQRSPVLAVIGTVVTVGAATALLFTARALDSRDALNDAAAAMDLALDAARAGDTDTARRELVSAGRAVSATRERLDVWWLAPTRLTPVVAPNARATVSTLANVDETLESLTASLDDLRFEQFSFDDGRVDLDQVATVQTRLTAADRTVSELLNTTAERSVWLVDPLVERLDVLQSRLADLGPTLDDAAAVLDVLPDILGADGRRRYLVVFVQPAEARGGGGFPGNWAELVVERGAVSLGEQGRSGDLNPPPGDQWRIEGHDEYLGRYDDFRVRSQWQSITMSPHFPTVADVMSQVYPQATGRTVDGVIRLGPRAVEALLRITGPVAVEGRDAPLDADDAVEFLTRTQYTGIFADNQDRIDYLGELVEGVFEAITEQGVGNPLTAARTMSAAIASGDITMWLPDRDEYGFVERLGLSGALPPADSGDAFTVTQHDLLPNKIDAWSQRTISYDVQVDADTDTVQGVLSVVVTNRAPLDGTDYQVGGQRDLPRATMRELITIYSPAPLLQVTVDGRQVQPLVQSEQGYLTHQVEIVVPTGRSAVIEGVVYRDLAVDEIYRLTVPPNPAVNIDRLKITVNNERQTGGLLDRPVTIACRPVAGTCAAVDGRR